MHRRRKMGEHMRFIWVMGPSGVGKKTFIEHLQTDAELRSYLDIPDTFVARGPSLGGQSEAITRAVDLAKIEAPVVVVKWQAIGDSEVDELVKLRPDAEHHIFHLQRPPEQIHEDLKERGPESEEAVADLAAFARNNLDACKERVRDGFKLTILDATDCRYKRING